MTKVLSDIQLCWTSEAQGMGGSACLPHYSQPDRQSAPFSGNASQTNDWFSILLGRQNNNAPVGSMAWNKFGTGLCWCFKILNRIRKFEQTGTMRCLVLHLSTMWSAPVWSQSKPPQRKLHWRIYKALLLCGTCWENMPRDQLLHTLLRLLPLRLSSCTVHQAIFKVLKTSTAFIKFKWTLLFHF